jgi:nitroreductase
MAGPEPLSQLMRARRSIRLYKDELVDPSVIESILDVARWAPTGKNEQPLRYTVVSGREQLKTLSAFCIDYFSLLLEQAPERALALGARGLVKTWKAGKDPILREAPQLIVAHGLQQNPMLVGSAFIALTQIDLQLVAYGLGGCWAGYLQIAASAHAPLREALKLPAGDTVAGALMFGVPRIKFRSIPPRKPLQVTWL